MRERVAEDHPKEPQLPARYITDVPPQRRWRELRTGLISAAAITALVLFTLLFARVGVIRGKKVDLYVTAPDVSGVLPGTEVWLSGKKSGRVTKVGFRSTSTDTAQRVLLTTEFLAEFLPVVRRDSYAEIRPGGNFIGAPVIQISAGSANSPPLAAGDTVATRIKSPITKVVDQVEKIGPEFEALAKEVTELNAKLSGPVGTIGNFRTRGMGQVPDVGGSMSRIMNKTTRGDGTIGLAMRGNLMARASSAMAATDSLRAFMDSDRGNVGRFRRDTTLMKTVGGLMAELDSLRALASDPLGTIGKARGDSALIRELARSKLLLDSLFRDMKRRPFRYIAF